MLRSERHAQALELADRLRARGRPDVACWLGRARANLGLGRWVDADVDSREAQRLAPADPRVRLVRGVVHYRLGRMDEAVRVLTDLVAASPPNLLEAGIALAETLHRAGRDTELEAFLARPGPWSDDPRTALFRSRFLSRRDPDAAIDLLRSTARSDVPASTRRVSGFEAVKLLDRVGRFREAWALAEEIHADTTPPHDEGAIVAHVREQAGAMRGGRRWFRDRAPAVRGVATVVALPRSGTTLLEQMLDAHPDIAGIGEYDGVKTLGEGLLATGLWPWDLDRLGEEEAASLQRRYLAGAEAMRRPGARWSFDKTLHAWRWLPAIASVLPGAVCLRIERDPRDTATSLFLSNFHPQAFGWTGSLESIRQVIAAERELAPLALRTLGIPHEDIRYEDLVEDPRGHMERVLARLGLPMDERVLAPQENARTVLTLSHEQVRKSINRGSIGRWKNYEFAFGPEWGA